MNYKTLITLLSFVTLIIISGIFINNANKKEPTIDTIPTPTPGVSKENCIADGCLLDEVDFPVEKLSADVEESLLKALDDEYKAYATYQAVMNTYGNIRPFVMIARAEQQHITSLQALFEKYGIQISENSYLNNIDVPGSIQGSCALGVTAEIENVKLYKNTLLPMVVDYPDITLVYTNLMNASEQKHLPAFMRCD